MIVGASLPQLVFEGTITFASVASTTIADQTITVGANLGGQTLIAGASVHLTLPNLQAGISFSNPRASSTGALIVRFHNTTGGALTPTGTAAKLVQF